MSASEADRLVVREVRPIRFGWWLIAILLPPFGWIGLALYFVVGSPPRKLVSSHTVKVANDAWQGYEARKRSAGWVYLVAGVLFTVGVFARIAGASAAPWLLIAAIALALIAAIGQRLDEVKLLQT